nr:MAG TPA: hypothetical protein [Caudoviricetes sp.]
MIPPCCMLAKFRNTIFIFLKNFLSFFEKFFVVALLISATPMTSMPQIRIFHFSEVFIERFYFCTELALMFSEFKDIHCFSFLLVHANVVACEEYEHASAQSDGAAGAGLIAGPAILHNADGTSNQHEDHDNAAEDSGGTHNIFDDGFAVDSVNGIDNITHNETS